MIIYHKNDSSLNIPVGLGPNVGPLDASLTPLEVDSSTVAQSITPSGDGFSSVTVNPYTVESLTVDPSTMPQAIIPENADAFSSVIVNPVNASIDSDIQPGNIREGVEILGVEGTFQGGTLQAKTIDSSITVQTVMPDAGNYGLSSVVVRPYTTERMTLDVSQNGLYTIIPQSADALSGADISVNVQSSFNWIYEARRGNITDVSNYSLEDLPSLPYGAAGILTGAPITTLPGIDCSVISGHGLESAFKMSNIGPHVDISVNILKGDENFNDAFTSCENITDASITINGFALVDDDYSCDRALGNAFINCHNLAAVDISIGDIEFAQNIFSNMFGYIESRDEVPKLKVRFTNFEQMMSGENTGRNDYRQNTFSWLLYNYYGNEVEVEMNAVNSIDIGNSTKNKYAYHTFEYAFNNPRLKVAPQFLSKINRLEGESTFGYAFYTSGISELTLGVRVIVDSTYAFDHAFSDCPNLETLNLTGVFENNDGENFSGTFENSPVKTVNSYGYATIPLMYGNPGQNILSSASQVETINVSEVDSEIHLDWQPNLNRQTVYSLLSKARGAVFEPIAQGGSRAITFYSDGLTVEDYPDGRIQAAYDAAVLDGWTINNLTVDAATSELYLVSPVDRTIDYEDSSTFTFIAGTNWTATASDPSVSLSVYSGGLGEFTVTVSIPAGHQGSSVITVTTANESFSLDLLVPEDINNFTPVDYIESTGQRIKLGNTMSEFSAIRADYEITAYNEDVFIGIENYNTDHDWRFYNNYGRIFFNLGPNGEGGLITYNGGELNKRYVGIFGLFTDNYPRFYGKPYSEEWSWSNGGESYQYSGSGTEKLCFASQGNYGKLWSLKVYDSLNWDDIDTSDMTVIGKQPLYNYVPMQRISNGEYGLFETVHNHFFTAAGITGGV